MSEEPRKWTFDTGQPRVDVDGVEWYACDPYPTWYRWVDNGDGRRQLITERTAPWRDDNE